jgi:hypothetical protein
VTDAVGAEFAEARHDLAPAGLAQQVSERGEFRRAERH